MGIDIERFDGSVDDELICPICQLVLENPLHLIQCEHVFCYSCIWKWIQTGNETCPIDRKKFKKEDLKTPRLMIKFLDKLDIKCDYANNGCTSIVKLEQLAHHKKDCKFNPNNHTANQATNQTTNQTANQTTNQTANQTTNQTANETTNQTANQITNQTANPTQEHPEQINLFNQDNNDDLNLAIIMSMENQGSNRFSDGSNSPLELPREFNQEIILSDSDDDLSLAIEMSMENQRSNDFSGESNSILEMPREFNEETILNDSDDEELNLALQVSIEDIEYNSDDELKLALEMSLKIL